MNQHEHAAAIAMMFARVAHRFHLVVKPHHRHGPTLLDDLALGFQASDHIPGVKCLGGSFLCLAPE